jgi:Protein of unknown function (DUF3828)
MINRRIAAAGLLFSFAFIQPDRSVVAAESSARDFLTGIYAAYKGNSDKSRGIPLTDDAAIRRYFEPQIAALMIKDMEAARKRQELPLLDGDPFIDAQDWDIGASDISVRDTGAGKAAGTVAFKNFGAPVTIGLELVKLKDGWRIADIPWGEERGSLKGLYVRR